MPRLSAGGARRSSLWRRLRPRAPALALLALAALALGGILAPEAEAQTETEVWSGNVTVSDFSSDREGFGYFAAAHPLTTTGGTLSDDDFAIDGTNYTVWRITVDTITLEWRPLFTVATGSTPAVADLPDKDELILRLTYGGVAGDFTLSDATYTDSSGDAGSQGFRWSAGHPSGAAPTAGQTMTVALLRTSTNNAPTVANTIPNQSAMVGTVFNYTVPDDTFTDADSDTLTYAATLDGGNELPSWLSFTAATRAFSGTPTAAQTVSVQVTASDGNGGSVSDFFDIVVSADTTTSVSGALVSNLNQSATSGGYGSGGGGTGHYFQDGGTDDLAQGFTTGTNATGYTLTSIEIPFAEDISAADIADLTVSLHADDGSGNNPAATALFALDNPASIDGNIGFQGSIPTDRVAATHEFTVPAANTTTTFTMSTDYYVVLTYDQDVGIWYVRGDSWDSGAAPGWTIATRSRYKRGSGSWTANPVGVPLMIRVNGTTVGGTPVTNAAPTLANPIDDQTATVGAAFDYTVPANTFADTDAADTLTYTATQSDDSALPLWLSFAAATRTFSGTPQAADVETLSVKVTASDGTDSVSDTFDIVVSAAPVCAAPDFGTRRHIWTSTVDVEAISVLGSVVSYGFDSGTGAGSLADNTFEIGSNDYTVGGIADVVTDIFQFTLTSSLTSTEVAALKLHVCETGYDFADATHNSSTHLYEFAVDLDWSMETTRTVYLSLPANRPATGDLEITGTAQVGQELTADVTAVADADGIVSSTAIYQWFRIDAGTETAIPGARGNLLNQYTLKDDDAGKQLRVKLTFTDQLGGDEALTSAAFPSGATVTALPAITIAADRPTATGKIDWIHYTLRREGDPAAELTVTVTFAGPADNDWSLERDEQATAGRSPSRPAARR